uniref:WAP domain-containing protein n=1 Tax=Cyprinus carpio TaxID=7962 RepID=A0A8C1YDH4_CYPCA
MLIAILLTQMLLALTGPVCVWVHKKQINKMHTNVMFFFFFYLSEWKCSAFSDAFCHVCITAKPGECPPQTSGSSCTVSCNSDSNCPNNEKCCSNGCGRYCTAPFTENAYTTSNPLGWF